MSISVEQLEDYYKNNPEAMEPKFNGDAKKAAEAYKNLESALTKTKQELAQLKNSTEARQVTENKVVTTDSSRNEPVPTSIQPLDGLKIPDPPKSNVWDKVDTDMRDHGVISEETAAELKANGVPDHLIHNFREVMNYAAKSKQEQAMKLLGGQENYEATVKFAMSLPEAERREINKALKTDAWSTVLSGLQSRRLATTANEPVRDIAVTSSSGTVANRIDFKSHNDLMRAMANPRYRSDPDYQNMIVEASNRFYAKKNKK
jgi:hypothetical protein